MNQPARITRLLLPAFVLILPILLQAQATPLDTTIQRFEAFITGSIATSIVVIAFCITAIKFAMGRNSGEGGWGNLLVCSSVLLFAQQWVTWAY